ncbi:hypothetical protein AB4K20DRAFT_1914624 [Rhizopus microsporus]
MLYSLLIIVFLECHAVWGVYNNVVSRLMHSFLPPFVIHPLLLLIEYLLSTSIIHPSIYAYYILLFYMDAYQKNRLWAAHLYIPFG